MSLFSARTWWSVPGASTDAFDRGALCVANIDNADDNQGACWCCCSTAAVLVVFLGRSRCLCPVGPFRISLYPTTVMCLAPRSGNLAPRISTTTALHQTPLANRTVTACRSPPVLASASSSPPPLPPALANPSLSYPPPMPSVPPPQTHLPPPISVPSAKLIVGSFSGFLRIYQPSTRGFSPEVSPTCPWAA